MDKDLEKNVIECRSKWNLTDGALDSICDAFSGEDYAKIVGNGNSGVVFDFTQKVDSESLRKVDEMVNAALKKM